MRKSATAILIFAFVTFGFLAVSFTAKADIPTSQNYCNAGTANAHDSGMPSIDGHDVPGLQNTPFSGSEVPGHMHVPDPTSCPAIPPK